MGQRLIIISLIFLCGCVSYTKVTRDDKGRIEKIESMGNVDTSIKEGDTEWKQSTKGEPLIKLPDIALNNL